MVGGYFYEYSGVTSNYFIRLNNDGTIDDSFNSGDGFNDGVNTIALQPDGKILVGGYFYEYSGVTANGIIRLNSDGTIDNTFNYGTGFDSGGGNVYDIVIQPDGKILVGGQFNDYDGNSANNIIRLNTGGTIDNTFNSGGGFNYDVYTIALQPDGNIVVGGVFTDYDGNAANYIIRLDTYGTIDNTFNSGGGFDNYVWKIVLQPDGNIVVGGVFTDYDGNAANYIIRLDTYGTIDNTFNSGGGFDDAVNAITLQPNGTILVGGIFNNYDSNTAKYFIRLNNDGTIDYSFNDGEGFDNYIYDILVQPNGDILFGGEFNYYNYSYYPYFTKIKNNGDLINCPTIVIPTTPFISTWKTTSPNETVEVPLQYGGNCYCTIDWGDGNTDLITYWDQPEKFHEYTNPGTYTITISGLTSNFAFASTSTESKIYSVEQFGGVRFGYNGVFAGCTNLNLTGVTDTPNLTYNSVLYYGGLSQCFSNCNSLTSVNNLNSWDLSNVTDLSEMFAGCTSFNQNINSLNVSNVNNMTYMFYNCSLFNSPLSLWNVSEVTGMNSMFYNCSNFNRPLSNWNVSGVTDMQLMFNNATLFNQDLSGWCVTNIPSPPFGFSTGSALTNPNKPIWGTCPP